LTAIQSGNAEDITSSDQSLETDLKSLLGDVGYAQFESYSKNDVAD
jgi:hypothetical protein